MKLLLILIGLFLFASQSFAEDEVYTGRIEFTPLIKTIDGQHESFVTMNMPLDARIVDLRLVHEELFNRAPQKVVDEIKRRQASQEASDYLIPSFVFVETTLKYDPGNRHIVPITAGEEKFVLDIRIGKYQDKDAASLYGWLTSEDYQSQLAAVLDSFGKRMDLTYSQYDDIVKEIFVSRFSALSSKMRPELDALNKDFAYDLEAVLTDYNRGERVRGRESYTQYSSSSVSHHLSIWLKGCSLKLHENDPVCSELKKFLDRSAALTQLREFEDYYYLQIDVFANRYFEFDALVKMHKQARRTRRGSKERKEIVNEMKTLVQNYGYNELNEHLEFRTVTRAVDRIRGCLGKENFYKQLAVICTFLEEKGCVVEPNYCPRKNGVPVSREYPELWTK